MSPTTVLVAQLILDPRSTGPPSASRGTVALEALLWSLSGFLLTYYFLPYFYLQSRLGPHGLINSAYRLVPFLVRRYRYLAGFRVGDSEGDSGHRFKS